MDVVVVVVIVVCGAIPDIVQLSVHPMSLLLPLLCVG